MKHDHIKRWNFICSYKGILFSGIIVYLILLVLYIILSPSAQSVKETLMAFPGVFLIWTMPILIIMTLLLFLSNIVLIFHEHFGYRRLLGTVFGLACIIGNLLCRRFFFTSLIGSYLGIVFIGTSVMGAVATHNKPELDNDFLIILGCYIGKKGKLMPLIRNRLNRAIHFAWEQEIATGKAIRYVPSGGKGDDEIMRVQSCIEENPENWICSYDDFLDEKKLIFYPLNIGNLAKKYWFTMGQVCILISSTILDFDLFVNELGLDSSKVKFIQHDLPINLEKNKIATTIIMAIIHPNHPVLDPAASSNLLLV